MVKAILILNLTIKQKGAFLCQVQKAYLKSGHPKSFWLICMTILWERFSYYGLTALLVLFLQQV